MNVQILNAFAILIGCAGSALLTYAITSPHASTVHMAGGGVTVLVAVALSIAGVVTTRGSVRRFQLFCADGDTDGSAAPRLTGPFGAFGEAVCARLRDGQDQLRAKTSEARRARMAARSVQGELSALRHLLDNMLDGVILVESDGAVTFANRAARRLLALPDEGDGGDEGNGGSEWLTRCPMPPLKAALDAAIRGETRDARDRRDIDCSDQAQRLVLRAQFQRVSMDDDPGQAPMDEHVALAILVRDVTREVELNRMKSDFASSVSHELKTPLCSMKAFLEMLVDGDIEGEEEQMAHVQMILDETDRLTRLIQNLLNLSRLESGVTRMSREPVDLRSLLSHLEEVLTPLAVARSQSLKFEISDFLPAITGDLNLLEQGIMNLVSNAIKYTPEGGRVNVRAGISGSDVEIAVEDTGVGIPEKALDLVFEKFTRIENHAGLKATGTGLGLPLAKFVASAHGGRITLESEVGQGSTFTMYLPPRRAEESGEDQLVGLEEIAG